MFEFFRDVLQEAKGIDTNTLKMIRAGEMEEKKAKNKRFIFSKRMKIVVYVLGALYLLTSIPIMMMAGGVENVLLYTAVNGTLVAVDIAVCVCLVVGKRKGEIAALIGVIVFFLLLYASIFVG